MRRLINSLGVALCLSTAAVGCGDENGSEPAASMVGTWDFIGFSDDGIEATTTGTAIFKADGSVSIHGTVTYPGQATEALDAEGTYQQTGTSLVMQFDGDPSTWEITQSGNEVLLTGDEAPPANTMRLRRS